MDTRLTGTAAAPVYVMLLEAVTGETDLTEDLAALREELGVNVSAQPLDTEVALAPMPARPLVFYPDPGLQTSCAAIDSLDDTVRAQAQDLLDTMDTAPPRTVGIAAPQVGILSRLAIVDTSRNPKHPGGHGLLILVNPQIIAAEGRANLPGRLPEPAGLHRQHSPLPDISLSMRSTLNGEQISLDAEGFEAVVLQHGD